MLPDHLTRLPEHFIEEIAKHPPMGDDGKVTWHEVQFQFDDGIICQCAVVNGTHVPFPQHDIDRFVRIVKIWHPDEL